MKEIIVARSKGSLVKKHVFVPTSKEIEFIKYDCVLYNIECISCEYNYNGLCDKFFREYKNPNISYDLVYKIVSNNWLKLHGMPMSRKHVSRETLRRKYV